MNINLLDCTLRDGGYYNNWDFDNDLLLDYLEKIALSKINFVELGLRNFSKEGFLGAFAYTTEDFLDSITLPKGPVYGVMVDAKTILSSSLSIKEAISALFVDAEKSKIGLVRVAAHFDEVEMCGDIVKILHDMGYLVGFNLMQAGGKDSKVILDKVKLISNWTTLDVLYFADSLGNMDSAEVIRIINLIKTHWTKPIGIHTHDNMGKGLNNTIVAMNEGVTWVDSTITGMGRGAGNTQTEYLLTHLNQSNAKNFFNLQPIYDLVIKKFEKLQKQHNWGSNLLYYLGAQNNVHPTYVQNILTDQRYSDNEKLAAINYLSELNNSNSYNDETLNAALRFFGENGSKSGEDSVSNLFNDKDILIITNANSTMKYFQAIKMYIEKFNPIVLSINVNDTIPSELIDYYVISHNSKFLSEFNLYKDIKKPLILPKCRFTENELAELVNLNLIDYGMDIKKNTLSPKKNHVIIPHDITVAYLLGILLESKIRTLSVVGFDGYLKDDVRQEEMVELLNLYKAHENATEINSLTPSTYPIRKGSIYAPSK
jgi:4-hydroxy 2-oxovalerate aldolase